jgi:[ribosomal protein S5]-alanine N-acetyltransferase
MQSKRLSFVQVGPEHATDFERVMSEPEMGRYTDVPCEPTEKQTLAFVGWMQRLNSSGRGAAWALSYQQKVIGFIRLNKIEKRNSIATIGFEIAKSHWGLGLASEALKMVVSHCHHDLGLHRLEATVSDGNTASARALEKAGFLKEGTQRSKFLHRNERCDVLLFARLATDPI